MILQARFCITHALFIFVLYFADITLLPAHQFLFISFHLRRAHQNLLQEWTARIGLEVSAPRLLEQVSRSNSEADWTHIILGFLPSPSSLRHCFAKGSCYCHSRCAPKYEICVWKRRRSSSFKTSREHQNSYGIESIAPRYCSSGLNKHNIVFECLSFSRREINDQCLDYNTGFQRHASSLGILFHQMHAKPTKSKKRFSSKNWFH